MLRNILRWHDPATYQNLTIYLLALWLNALTLRSEPQERFAANMKELRKERGWSQEDLSGAYKLHLTAISKMEPRKESSTLPTIVIVAEALQVPAGTPTRWHPDRTTPIKRHEFRQSFR